MKTLSKKNMKISKEILFILLIIFFICAYIELTKHVDEAFSSEYSKTDIYDNHGRYTGNIDENDTIYDNHGRYKGYIGEDNVIYDNHGRNVGTIVERGSTYGYKNYNGTTGDPDYDPLN